MGVDVATIAEVAKSHPENRMAKHFTDEYYNSLPEEKQKLLLLCCKSGIENADSGMGLYAMSPTDYDDFKPYFDKVIRDYHGITGTLKHVNNWDISGVKDLPEGGKLDLTKLGLGDTSMRVRVGRNLASYPLPGNMTQDDRVNLELGMIAAFKKLIADPAFGGTYNSLTPGNEFFVDDAKYKELVADHIMFKDMSVDPYLLSAGISSHWPYGRGCYVSEDKGFIVWVGEEDHLRIMCMKKGTMLNEVFDRLHSCLKVIEAAEGCTFALSPDYGYVTSCPTNLGSGMRASLHIALPALTKKGKDVSEAKAAAKTLGLSVRGIGGEHTEAGEDGTVDISPSARLCIQESEIVAALYKGVKLLMEKETAAAGGGGGGDSGSPLDTIAKIKVSHPENRMAKHFSNDFYHSLPEDKQKLLLLCCKSGIENADSGMGLYAMSPTDYDELKEYFDKVIRDYHGITGTLKHVNNWDISGVKDLPEGGKLDLTKLGLGDTSMRVRVGRNLASYPLPGNMTQDDRVNLELGMIAAFKKLIADPAFGGTYNSLTPGNEFFVDDAKYKELVADHIMFKDMSVDPYLLSAGISSHWPYGRGCYVSEDKGFIVWVGEEDHLRIMCMKKGTMLNEVFDRLHSCLKVIEAAEGCTFALSPDYGYVTSCPTNLGSGMRASLHIALPALTKKGKDVSEAKAAAKTLGLSVRGIGGEHTEAGEDGTVDISPSARLCIQESEIVAALYKGVKLLMEKETSAANLNPATIRKIRSSHPENRMAKHFDDKYFESLSAKDQARLLLCCKSGVDNPDSGMGLYAMNPTDYDDFKPYFDKVIRDYHGITGELKHINNWDISTVKDLPKGGKLDLAVIGLGNTSMRVRVGRNLKDFPLPGNMTQEDRVSLEKRMISAFECLMKDPEFGGTYNTLTPGNKYSIDEFQYQELVDEHIMFKDMSVDPYLLSAGISAHWPYGRGCYVSRDRGFIVWVGEEDHLRIMCMKKGTIINEVFDRLHKCLAVIEAQPGCVFAKSPDYGYVTSCPTNLGSGMRASLHLQLPALTKKGSDVSDAKAVAKSFGLSVRGAGGEHTAAGTDGTVDISPSARLCIQEADIVAALYQGSLKLRTKENLVRWCPNFPPH